jgi:putative ABC transport system permease protein
VILSHGYWLKRFGGDPSAVGRTLTVDGTPREIIGVTGPEHRFLDLHPALYLPLRIDRSEVFFGHFSYQGIARLKPGVSLAQADADVARMIPIAVAEFPPPPGFSKEMLEKLEFGPRLRPLKEDVVGDLGKTLWLLLGTVGLVLLVACANVANLLLVRAEGRRQQLAIRSALGADRGRIARDLLLESAVLGLAGGVAGVGLAYAGLRLLLALAPRGLPRLEAISIDPAVLAFTVGVSLLAALIFGAAPVVKLRAADLVSALKEESRGGSGGRRQGRARDLLVAAQIALALVLIIGSGLMVRSFRALASVDPGFRDPEAVQTLRVTVPGAEVKDDAEAARVHEAILGKLAALPGVGAASLTSSVAMDEWRNNDPIFVEDFPPAADAIPPLRRFKWVAPGYFATMGNPLRAGRSITWDDVHERRKVAVVSENFAREFWREPAAALGRRIRVSPKSSWREIVGVVGDVRDDGAGEDPPTIVFWPMVMEDFWEPGIYSPGSMVYVLRSPRVGTAGFLDEARAAVWSVNPRLPLAEVHTLAEIQRGSMARTRFTLIMLALAAATAVLLGGIGIYGVTSYAVAQRSREIGVRMALGARRWDVSRLVLRHGFALAAAGVGTGLLAAFGLTRLMASVLFGVGPSDPPTFVAAGAATALLALAASWLPARRAAGVNPIDTLH